MAKKQFITDPEGRDWPTEYVDPYIVKRDSVINELFAEAQKHRMVLKDFKQRVKERIKKYLNEIAAQHGEKFKGNTTLYNFAQNTAIEININEVIKLDERLKIAEEKIRKCFALWSAESRKEMSIIINDNFAPDKNGNVNVARILSLRKYKFPEPLWLEAMDLISESITVSSTKEYQNFKRKDSEGKWHTLSLNWSSL
jgi:Protein of unknown function (DUF3164)